MSCFTLRQSWVFYLIVFILLLLSSVCLWTHPLSFSLRLPKQEVSSSALKSCDKKSKLPRTSSTARVSSDDELFNMERSFCGRTRINIKGRSHTVSVLTGVCICVYINTHRYLQDGCQVQCLVFQGSQLLLRAALVLKHLLQLCDQDSQPESLGSALDTAHHRPPRGRSSSCGWGRCYSWGLSSWCGQGRGRIWLTFWGVLEQM